MVCTVSSTPKARRFGKRRSVGSVQIRASAQAPDGMIVRDWALFYTHDITKMFPEAELTKARRKSASR